MMSAHKKFRKGYDEANVVLHVICEIDEQVCYLDGFHKIQVPFLRLCFELFPQQKQTTFPHGWTTFSFREALNSTFDVAFFVQSSKTFLGVKCRRQLSKLERELTDGYEKGTARKSRQNQLPKKFGRTYFLSRVVQPLREKMVVRIRISKRVVGKKGCVTKGLHVPGI